MIYFSRVDGKIPRMTHSIASGPVQFVSFEKSPSNSVSFGVVADRDIRIPISIDKSSTAQLVEQPEEDGQVRVPGQQAIDQLAAGLDDLTG